MLEVALNVRDHSTELLPCERTTMHLKRTTLITAHDPHAFPRPLDDTTNSTETVLAHLAQSEITHILDERAAFAVCVRGEDATCLLLRETREDCVDAVGGVTVMVVLGLEQTRGGREEV